MRVKIENTLSLLILFAVFVLWGVWFKIGPGLSDMLGLEQGTLANSGAIGDSFGALNALFAAFGFAAVIITLVTQGQSLREQHNNAQKQQFEASFFQLLSLMRELRSEVEVRIFGARAQNLSGSQAIDHLAAAIRYNLPNREADQRPTPDLAQIYRDHVHANDEEGLGAYFRVIYSILRRISEHEFLSKKEKIQYGNLLRSQLTTSDCILIGYNGLTEESNNFDDYIIEFRLLKYIPQSAERYFLEQVYPPEAFAPRD